MQFWNFEVIFKRYLTNTEDYVEAFEGDQVGDGDASLVLLLLSIGLVTIIDIIVLVIMNRNYENCDDDDDVDNGNDDDEFYLAERKPCDDIVHEDDADDDVHK